MVSETAIITLPSGDKYTGLSEDLNGTGVFVNSVGEKLEGNFNYGLLQGLSEIYYETGQLYSKTNWGNGDWIEEIYYKNG